MADVGMIKPNQVKSALQQGRVQLGLWSGLNSHYAMEILAGSGYDWITIDMEHAPNDMQQVLSQLQAMSGYPVEPAVRLNQFDKDLVKQYLDMGVRILILPNVESAEQAREIVNATRYPKAGVRGVVGLSRANRWGRVKDYFTTAHEQLMILAQIESAKGVKHAHSIASVVGLDGVFVGPNDLAASMGLLGQYAHPEVQQSVEEVARIMRDAGKIAGTLAFNDEDAHRYLGWGYTILGIGSDQGLLARASDELVGRFRKVVAEGKGG